MKLSLFLTSAFLASLLTTSTLAAPDDKGGKERRGAGAPGEKTAEALKPFDKNANQQIDPEELATLQQTFDVLKKLDANNNGEIEQAELDAIKSSPGEGRRGRIFAGLKQADRNGNRKIDADEVEALQKAAAGTKMLERLDRNNNGKLDPDEVDRLNERLAKGVARTRSDNKPAADPPGTPEAAKAPATPAIPEAETAKPDMKKKEEKAADKPSGFTPEIKPLNSFGS